MTESYTEGGKYEQILLKGTWALQTYTPVASHTLACLDLYIRQGAPRIPITAEIFEADDDDLPTGPVLSSGSWINPLAWSFKLHKVIRLIMSPCPQVAGTKYAMIIKSAPSIERKAATWRYTRGTNPYPRGYRRTTFNNGLTWQRYHQDDHLFFEFGPPFTPLLPPPPPVEHWMITDIKQTLLSDGFLIIVTTNVPVHLYLHWSTKEPWTHKVVRERRGIRLPDGAYWCFAEESVNEQLERGDTLYHTFEKRGWPTCQTRFFTFTASLDHQPTSSQTAILMKHFAEEAVPLLFYEPWSPPPERIPRFNVVFLEEWPSPPPPPPTTLERSIAAATDECNAWRWFTHWMFGLAKYDHTVGYAGPKTYAIGNGLRFLNITIPPGSKIHRAHLRLVASRPHDSQWCHSIIEGELSPNPLTFIDLGDLWTRTPTRRVVYWEYIDPWMTLHAYLSPNIGPLIQEIIDQPGWASANPLVLFWNDWGDESWHSEWNIRSALSFTNEPLAAPLLHIEFSPP